MTHVCGGSAHWMQLFDSAESLADEVSRFLHEGFVEATPQLVVVTPVHWTAIANRLRHHGVPAEAALATGRLTVRDAGPMLESLIRGGQPDREIFDRTVGALVRHLARAGKRVRIYGEMVDLLAGQGAFGAAQRLEQFWNALGKQQDFTLFCGYSAESFGSQRSTSALGALCKEHTRVRSSARDVLGSFLIDTAKSTHQRHGAIIH